MAAFYRKQFEGVYVPVEIVKLSLWLVKRQMEEKKCVYRIRCTAHNVYTTDLENMINTLYRKCCICILDSPDVVAYGLISQNRKT